MGGGCNSTVIWIGGTGERLSRPDDAQACIDDDVLRRLEQQQRDDLVLDHKSRASLCRRSFDGFADPVAANERIGGLTGRDAAVVGLPGDPTVRVIAQIGPFTEYKGQSVLLRAARKILDREPKTAFLMVGFAR